MSFLPVFSLETWILLITLIYIFIMYGQWTFEVFEKLGIPGPKPVIYMGTVNKQNNVYYTGDCENAQKYGRIWGGYEFRKPVLAVADPDMLRTIVVKEFFTYFTNRRMRTHKIYTEWNTRQNILLSLVFTHRISLILAVFVRCPTILFFSLSILFTTSQKSEDVLQYMIDSQATSERMKEKHKEGNYMILTDHEVVSHVTIFMFAGCKTFLAYNLARNPEVMKCLQQEIDSTFMKKGPVQYEALMQMEYLNSVVSDSMRLYPLAAHLERNAKEIVKINGITIPKGMAVMIPSYALHHDPEVWPEPEDISPDRFSKKNKQNISPYTYLSFGAGPRNCLGMDVICSPVPNHTSRFDTVDTPTSTATPPSPSPSPTCLHSCSLFPSSTCIQSAVAAAAGESNLGHQLKQEQVCRRQSVIHLLSIYSDASHHLDAGFWNLICPFGLINHSVSKQTPGSSQPTLHLQSGLHSAVAASTINLSPLTP
ncbi:cytochrome P450 3A27-like [Amphiprion ocellaris]|uniref:cytochrome P450 3A27-like n=1 Tax=Amphiprion ocellaris TaxID=80972 RepID=UPI002410D853|nr:cytochrome P450 3A27-like [Amphiprion ocellaris]